MLIVFFPLTTVMGPLISVNVVFVNLLINDFINVDFPVPGGPTTAIITGGGSSSGYGQPLVHVIFH